MTSAPSGDTRASQAILSVIILAVLGLMTYANTFEAPFVFDDRLNITDNPLIRVTELSTEALARIFKISYRPLANLSFAANYYVHGYDVSGYHVVNLIIHIITALLVWLVTRQTLHLCHLKNALIPFFAAALWLVNPVHTESVTYIVQRMNSLAAMFYILALSCYIRARMNAIANRNGLQRRLLYVLCLTAAIFGLASKQIVATLPAILLLYEWFFFKDLNKVWLKKQLPWMGLTILTIIALTAIYMGNNPLEKYAGMYEAQGFTMGQRLLTEAGVIIYYISLLLFPHPARLNLLYDFPLSRSLFNPIVTVMAISALFTLLILAVYAAKKNRLMSFATLWFLITLSIESSVIGLALIYEHRTYLPSIFPFIALTALLMKPLRARKLSAAILGVLIVICGIWTHQRNTVWNDTIRFWRDNVAKAPHVPDANNNLGQVLLGQGQTEQAVDRFKIAIKQDPGLEAAHVNLGVALRRLGKLAPAIAEYQTALTINPKNIDARFNLAMLLKKYGRTAAAINQLEKIITIHPNSTGAMLNLGTMLMEQGNNDQALAWFKRAAALDSSDTRILNNLGIVLQRLNSVDEAIAAYRQGLALDPHNPLLHNSLGLALMEGGQYPEAARHFQQALAADPELAEAYNNLGLAAEYQGEIDRAIDYYRQALQCAPAYDLARYNQAALLLKTGQPNRAISLLQETGAVKPEHWPALNRLLFDLANAQKLSQATALAEKMAAAAPDDAALYYNLACLYAKQNDPKNALARLKKAVDMGYDRWQYMMTDPDLKNIQDTDYFKNLLPHHGR